MPPFISTIDMPVCNRSVRHAIREECSQLSLVHAPVLPSASPFLCNIHHGKMQHFQQAFIRGKHRFCLGHLPKLTVEALNGIGRMDQSANLLGVLELGVEIRPDVPLQDPGLKFAFPITRCRHFHLAKAGPQCFAAVTVAAVVRPYFCRHTCCSQVRHPSLPPDHFP